MEIFGKLGIDFKLLIAQIINFGLLLLILKFFVYKPVIKRIEKDEQELLYAQKQSKILQKKQNNLKVDQSKKLKEAQKQAKDIVKEAKQIANKIKIDARKEANEEKKAVIEQIKNRLK